MNNEKALMEKIECHSKAITKGFEFRWTIEQRPRFLSLSLPLRSPVFKALQWNWTIEAQRRTELGRGRIDHRLDISLNLVDGKGVKVETIPNHPFFDAIEMSALVSVLDVNGEILIAAKDLIEMPSMKRFGERLNNNAKLGSIDVTDERRLIQGPIILVLDVIFPLGLSTKILSDVKNNYSPLDTVENNGVVSMKNLFAEGKFSDFVIRTGDGGEIRAHRAILNNSSRYFEALFELGGVEVQRGELTVPESHAVMNALVRFLYTGEPPKDIGGGDGSVEELFVAADKYQVSKLKAHLESAVDSRFSVENVCGELIRAASRGDQCLKAKAAEFIHFHRKAVVNTEGWRQLSRDHPDLVASLL